MTRFECDGCHKLIDMNAPEGSPEHSNGVCVDATPGFKEYDHYCDECYPKYKNHIPAYDADMAYAVEHG